MHNWRALDTEQLLKKSSLNEMWTPVRLNDGSTKPYGFGWAIHKLNGHRLVEHDGAWQGFTTHIARYVDDRLPVIVLTTPGLGALRSRQNRSARRGNLPARPASGEN
ncbi:MAG TPA: hypothetical protein VKS44_13805 [Candidatus Acidoferrales bacterium]|nr:hypothetical protein [Candidatus Acidoferrales bacterium]